ncbi:hypothetical protein HED60_02550 [Planctomycetales bacterium ZRK34]|nr:hypothetical protein HED60_02550 [Planctomycetales bacterium ZRK34]
MSERDIIKIAVTPQAKAAIEAVCRRYGMSQVEMASRLYTWFAQQDEVLQTAVLDILPRAVRPDVAELMLRRLAEETSGASGDSARGMTTSEGGNGPRPAKAARTTRRSVHTTTKLPGSPAPAPGTGKGNKAGKKSSKSSTRRRG